MDIIYTTNKKRFIAYNKHFDKRNKAPYVIFVHGFKSNMYGEKALAIEQYCQNHGYNYIRFDNFGSGASSGKFSDETVSTWLAGLNLVIENLTDGPVILIGSSLGAWLSLLSALKPLRPVAGIISISGAPDFTEELIWQKLSSIQKEELYRNNLIYITGQGKNCNSTYPISYKLIKDGKRNLLLDKKKISITCPVYLIHGMQDDDVPWSFNLRLVEKITSNNITVRLIKDGDHKLSRPQDLLVITNCLEEISTRKYQPGYNFFLQ